MDENADVDGYSNFYLLLEKKKYTMKVLILFVSLFCAAIMVQPVYSQNDGLVGGALRDNMLVNDTDLGGELEKDKKKQAVIVIGRTLMAGMPLKAAVRLLGIPKSITINRGSEQEIDSICIVYLNHGLKVHALTNKTTVEELEVLPTFKGEFSAGIKIGSKFSSIIKTFGMPASKEANIVKYPEIRMYLFLRKDTLISAKLFDKNSKILDYKLIR
ncbi:MAG: hypothetical protein MK234_06750 [Nitrospinales bacterium]|nr:hypothetical protein [Nitrospinales bacterium]